mgnify:CR=1 FL=1
MLHIAGLLDTVDGGTVEINGKVATGQSDRMRTRMRRNSIGFIYQFHHLLPEFTALENVMMPCSLGGMEVSRSREKAASLLQRVGLADNAHGGDSGMGQQAILDLGGADAIAS